MSDKEKNAEHIGASGIYSQLLSIATSAKGNEAMDPSIGPMDNNDRKWLEDVLNEFACAADPVKKLKLLIAKPMNFEHNTEDDLRNLESIVESLIDLICQIDFSLNFCQLNGLKTIEDLLDKKDDEIDRRIIGIVSEIAQNNQPAQKKIVATNLLSRLLKMFKDGTGSQKTKLKLAGAISSIVKCHPPGVVQFCKLNGPEIVMEVFYEALKNDDSKLVHRCVVTIVNIGSSAAPELIAALKVDVPKYVESIKKALLPHAEQYSESLAYLNS